jgi:hypothetical protein
MPIVDYNIVDLYENKIGLEQIKEICKEVFERLPDIYIKGYKKIFNTDKYRFSCKVRYELYDSTGLFHDVSACVHEYTQEEFGKIDIEYQENLSKLFTDTSDTEWKEGFKHILSRNLIEPFIRSETPVYNGFRCWLYQGICNGLGFKCSGLTVNHQDNVKLFGE